MTTVVAWARLERILRSIFQLVSSALARSPGPRIRAWAVLTVFCPVDSGRYFPVVFDVVGLVSHLDFHA